MSKLLTSRMTAPLPSAIATIVVQGSSPYLPIAQIIGTSVTDNYWTIGRVRLLNWPLLGGNAEQVVVCRVSSESVEIHCHGGVAVTSAILDSLKALGCKVVQPAELIRQTIPSGDFAAAIKFRCQQAMIEAKSERAVGILLDQAGGVLHDSLISLHQMLLESRWQQARDLTVEMNRWNELGLHLTNPWQVVLAGPPNVGKSSLINAIAGQAVAIVHPEAGTTRDWLEAETMIDGWPVNLTDTAGLRDVEESVEREGVRRARERIANAELVILVVDLTVGWTDQHEQILQQCLTRTQKPRLLIAENKSDLAVQFNSPVNPLCRTVACSASSSIAGLLESISQVLVPSTPLPGQVVVFEPALQRVLHEIQTHLDSEVVPGVAAELQLLAQQLLRSSFDKQDDEFNGTDPQLAH